MNIHWVKRKKLKEADYNPRTLKEKDYKDIKNSLKKFGFVEPVVVNKNKERNGIIVGGHQRVMIARELGIEDIPVVYVDLDIKDEKELNIRLNKNLGRFDYDVLANNFELEDLFDWGFEEWELGTHNELLEIPEDIKDLEVDENKFSTNDLVERGLYTKFELLMTLQNKKELISKLNYIKDKQNYEKLEEALMYLVKGEN